MALIMEIMKTIAQPIGELAVWLEETYQVSIDETTAKWHELTGMNITVKEGEVSHAKVQSIDVDSTIKNKKPKKSSMLKIPKIKETCQHIFTSGKKAGEQCSTKPKGGASYCSAHRSKNNDEKDPKKVKRNKVDNKVDSEFASDSEVETKTFLPHKKEVKKKKKTSGDSDLENSDDAEAKAPPKKEVKKKKKTNGDSDLENSDVENLSEPEVVAPLLKKNKKKGSKAPRKQYNTDDEIIDRDLNLTDDECGQRFE